METLYSIDAKLRDCIEQGFHLDEETGEIWFADEDMESLQMERAAKLEGCGLYIKNQRALIESIREEEKALADRRKSLESRLQRFEGYVLNSLDEFGGKVETAKVRMGTRKSTRLIIEDEKAVPSDYMRVKTSVSYDKAAMTRAIKGGAEIPGACLVTAEKLQVK